MPKSENKIDKVKLLKKIAGAFLISLPFLVVFILGGLEMGWFAIISIYCLVVVIGCIIGLGIYLLGEDIWSD